MLKSLFHWLGTTQIGLFMRDSDWGFAAVETLHLLGLAALGGAVVTAALSAAGVILRDAQAGAVLRGVRGLGVAGLTALILSGVLLVSSKPLRYYFDTTFRIKLALLALAITASLALWRNLYATTHSVNRQRLLSVIAAALWLSVGMAGRIIGFL